MNKKFYKKCKNCKRRTSFGFPFGFLSSQIWEERVASNEKVSEREKERGRENEYMSV
jgi:hypothetical protein